MLPGEGDRTRERVLLATENKMWDKFPPFSPDLTSSNINALAISLRQVPERKAPK